MKIILKYQYVSIPLTIDDEELINKYLWDFFVKGKQKNKPFGSLNEQNRKDCFSFVNKFKVIVKYRIINSISVFTKPIYYS